MYAIEFQAQAHEGLVQIPARYAAWKNKRVKVILLEPEIEHSVQPVQFNAVKLRTKGYRFDREEANER
jgi:hypothetical protein